MRTECKSFGFVLWSRVANAAKFSSTFKKRGQLLGICHLSRHLQDEVVHSHNMPSRRCDTFILCSRPLDQFNTMRIIGQQYAVDGCRILYVFGQITISTNTMCPQL